MLVAVVHARGGQAAREVIFRAHRLLGEPDGVMTSGDCAVAGWRSSFGGLTMRDGCAVEGNIEFHDGIHPTPHDVERGLAQSKGDFALICSVRDGLFAAPGPGGGHRPIFVSTCGEWTAASTRLRVLLDLLDSRPRIDLDYLAASTIADYPLLPTATPYAGVMHIPLCEAWVLAPEGVAARKPISRNPPRDELRGSERELAQRLYTAIETAVERSARGAANIGVMLSGGLDSSSILVTLERLVQANRLSPRVDAYSWEFETRDPGDDRPYRRAVERKIGKAVHPIEPTAAGRFVRRAMVLDASPCNDIPCPLWLALDDVASRHGVNCILTGLGGDNLLDGDARLLATLGRRGAPIEALRRAFVLKGPGRPTWKVREFIFRPLLRSLMPEGVRRASRRLRQKRRFDWMGPRFKLWLEQRAALTPAVETTLDSSPAERYEAFSRLSFMADMALIRSQQEEATRCRRADPLFDDDLLRVVAALPPLSLLAGGYSRGLMRQAMADLLPEEVTSRTNKANMEPALAEMVSAAGGFDSFGELARVGRLADLGFVEPKPFRAHFDRLTRHPLGPFWWSVWPALTAEEFLRQYDEGWHS